MTCKIYLCLTPCRVVEALARKVPKTMAQLRRVEGLPETKISQYGTLILQVGGYDQSVHAVILQFVVLVLHVSACFLLLFQDTCGDTSLI